MKRRALLGAIGSAGALSSAGCLSSYLKESPSYAPPLVEDRPNAAYVPSHTEGMKTAGTAKSGRYRCALAYTYPHRFWLITGTNRKKVEINENDSLHLMVTLWDERTGVRLPSSSVNVEVSRPDETITRKSLWPMLSQPMGFHFGDNVSLPAETKYSISIRIGPSDARMAGALEGAFTERETLSLSLDYNKQTLKEIPVNDLDNRQGKRGAVDPMETKKLPTGQLPARDSLSGRAIGRAKSGGATFALQAMDQPPNGIDGDGPYLAVSPRTPYNRYPLPFMSLSATVSRGKKTVFEGTLPSTIEQNLGYHYGSTLGSLESEDTVTVSFDAPPQASRHEGYETAFLKFESVQTTA